MCVHICVALVHYEALLSAMANTTRHMDYVETKEDRLSQVYPHPMESRNSYRFTHYSAFSSYAQIHSASQQRGFVRVKRGIRPIIPAGSVIPPGSVPSLTSYAQSADSSNQPTDPYFPLQWYLRNTGQNGGKVRLDLNVQAAWDQGITGKNVTTAIMDDGEISNLVLRMPCTSLKC